MPQPSDTAATSTTTSAASFTAAGALSAESTVPGEPADAADAPRVTRGARSGKRANRLGRPARPVRQPRSAFDVCQAGVVLRSLLFVHGVLALGLAFASPSWRVWLGDLSLAVAMALPATLLWLMLVCAAQTLWVRLPLAGQWAAMMVLGGLCAYVGWLPMLLLDLITATGPALVAPLACGAALAAAMFQWLLQRARLQLPATTLARLDELQSRIRPHFLFNALNSAVALVRLDPARAEEVLEDLAELFRAALVGSGEQVTLGEEVALARRYLAIEQVRFGERLKVSWHIDDAALGARVPSLMLQPLVENAVRHGVEVSAEGGEIQIRAQAHKGQALISVTNSVPRQPSGPPHKGQGMALRNVRERLQLLHDLTMRFEAGGIDGERYRVRIALPLQPDAPAS